MLTAWPTVIDEHSFPEVFAFCERYSMLSKNLYNAALFRIRQTFTGWDKKNRSANEQEVFAELDLVKAAYPKKRIKHVLSYSLLENLMRVTCNPDFFAGLSMQTAQHVLRRACDDFSNWLKALRKYKAHAEKFLGKPRMPRYCKSDRKTFTLTNQDAVLYRDENDPSSAVLKLPGISSKQNIRFTGFPTVGRLKQVSVKPYYGKYVLTFVFEDSAAPFYPDLPNMAGIDFGTDNIAALACTDSSSVVCKGGAVLAECQLFAKRKASAVSSITKGHEHVHAQSHHLNRLSIKHDCRMNDMLHKVSTFLVKWCIRHRVGTLVLGVNKLWKQNSDMGKQNNQTFVSIPHARLRWMITYKASIAGITVVEQEESYTSKADITAKDFIPVYGEEEGTPQFSGRRTVRGTYRTSKGYAINADCNGAANILRKAFPDAWDGVKDFRFLAVPECCSFLTLNHIRYHIR